MINEDEERPPIKITFMLTCYCTGDPANTLGEDHWNSPAGWETRTWLRSNGLIDEDNRATEKGEHWVKKICSTPLPRQVWI